MLKKSLFASLAIVMAFSLGLLAAGKKYTLVEKYAAEVQKLELPLQEAINKVMEEYGGIPIAANLEPRQDEEDDEGGYIFCVQVVKPAKEGKPASVWEIVIDAHTGELQHMENATRWRERELKEQEKEREKRRKREEKERKEEKQE